MISLFWKTTFSSSRSTRHSSCSDCPCARMLLLHCVGWKERWMKNAWSASTQKQSAQKITRPRQTCISMWKQPWRRDRRGRSEEHTSELQSRGHLVCRLLLEKKKHKQYNNKEYPFNHNYASP